MLVHASTSLVSTALQIPVSQMYEYECNPSADNPVGSEYFVMEEPGTQIERLWGDMPSS
ncbi:hypothetical protein BDW62DRAFT_194797 [Aspergillus aurantiobrunneus]